MTAPTSVHPRSVDEILPDARALVAELGRIPSRNKVKTRLRVGGPKADEILTRLRADAEPPVDPWEFAEQEPVEPEAVVGTTPTTEVPSTAVDEVSRTAHVSQLGHVPVVDTEPGEIRHGATDFGLNRTWRPNRLWAGLDQVRGRVPASCSQEQEAAPEPQVTVDVDPAVPTGSERVRPVVVWPLVLLALPAFVAVWAGWVELGRMAGFGVVNLLPGIVPDGRWSTIDTAITLPIGVETYAAYGLYVWLSGRVPAVARRFAKVSAVGSLVVGAAGQGAYHLMASKGMTSAPWQITVLVACLPVAVLGMGAALAHLVRDGRTA